MGSLDYKFSRSLPFVMSIFFASQLLSFLIFSGGFLLSRVHLKQYAPSVLVSDSEYSSVEIETESFERTLILIIDALRLDFVFRQPYSNTGSHVERMRRTKALIDQLGDSAFVAAFPADPPTTTMQRVRALLTGSLPTFLDVGSVFSGGEILEDNIFFQSARHGMRIGAIGDDTWMQLFPPTSIAALNISSPYPSLNVKDLHTVDNGVTRELNNTYLESNDWEILVAHYLGVDHAGHTYGVDSDPMLEKLDQMDQEVLWVLQQMILSAKPGQLHERTLLIVLGDHGQTMMGDHGGGTPEEVDSLLLAINVAAAAEKHTGKVAETEAKPQESLNHTVSDIPVMAQLDFTASLASLLGVPVPFENIGARLAV